MESVGAGSRPAVAPQAAVVIVETGRCGGAERVRVPPRNANQAAVRDCHTERVEEHRLAGGNTGGAVLIDGTVRRAVAPWTPTVHAVLDYLEARGFGGAPRALGIDEQGREVLSYLPGSTVGDRKPWPVWCTPIPRWMMSVAGCAPTTTRSQGSFRHRGRRGVRPIGCGGRAM